MTYASRALTLAATLMIWMQTTAQWNVYTQKLQRSLMCDVMAHQQALPADTFRFFGPAFSLDEEVRTPGYDLLKQDTIYKLSLPEKVRISRKNAFLYINCYADNIRAYNINIADADGNRYERTFTTSGNHYQLPAETPLMQWQPGIGQPPSDSITISEVTIRINSIDPHKRHAFVIGELKLLAHQLQQKPAKGYFFYQLTRDSLNLLPTFTVPYIGSSYPISQFTMFRDIYAQSFVFKPNASWAEKTTQDSTLALFRLIIGQYPYYKEHHLNKQQVMAALESILATAQPFQQKLGRIDSLISDLSDGHFYIEKAASPAVSGPVHVKQINDKIRVIAVFDPALQQQLHPGCELLEVDGIPAEKYLQTIAIRYYGDSAERRNQAIARMLYKSAKDSTVILVADNGTRKTLTYYYNRPLKVPDNFKPQHGAVRLENNCFYYRLNRWDNGDWLNFFNQRRELEAANAIIFDLRGNTGGAEVEAFKMASCFIKQPVVISKSLYALSDDHLMQAENVVTPNKFLRLADKKVVLLVDNNTACASEIFVYALQRHAGAVVMGSERTSGSYASGEVFYLPFNLKVHVNVLNKFSFGDQQNEVELKGITPDIPVALNSYKDLYPYEDKVLKTAYKIIAEDVAVHR